MPTPEDYRDEARDQCDKCQDAYRDKISLLETENMALRDYRDELKEDLERVSKERDEAKERYAELVETTARRTDQAQG